MCMHMRACTHTHTDQKCESFDQETQGNDNYVKTLAKELTVFVHL